MDDASESGAVRRSPSPASGVTRRAAALELVAAVVLAVAPAVVLGRSTTFVSRATALSLALGVAQIVRLRREAGPTPPRAAELDAPLVALAVLGASLVQGPPTAPVVLGIQAATLALVWSGRLAPARTAARLARSLVQALVDRLRDVVFAVLAIVTVVVPWIVQRLVAVDPLARRSGRRGWATLQRGARPSPSIGWARDRTLGRAGWWLRIRRSFASIAALVVVSAMAYEGARAAPAVSFGDDDVAVPAALHGAAWWQDYYRVAQWLNIPGEGHAYDPLGPVRLRDVSSESINVVDGTRRTWSPPPCPACHRLTVWVYGGSTTFGMGQRDDFTIPSQLAKLAWQDGIALDVRNRGMPADMHWEEAQRFAWDTASEAPPDLVYFYDGTNEMWASMTLDSRGWGDDETRWNPEAENARATYRRLVDTQEGFFDPPQPDVEVDDERSQTSRRLTPEDLARHVVARYTKSRSMSAATSSAHHVLTRWFWQPCFQSGRPVVGEPTASTAVLDRKEALCRAASKLLPEPVTDLSTLFDGRTAPVFIDDFHTGEDGALTAARAIYRELEPDLRTLLSRHDA